MKQSTIELYQAAHMIESQMISLLVMIPLICSLRFGGALLPTPPNATAQGFHHNGVVRSASLGALQSQPFADEAGPKASFHSCLVRPCGAPGKLS
ncbi:MAG: hypothetical protein DMG13_27145 [Acidobacteria bacterium]|nr:MAG: hypothetical protein DMG13_27145 [Acidobacteriota bacterium]